MIAVDTSALVAIGLDEPERIRFLKIIRDTPKALISTVSVVETKMLLYGRKGHRAVAVLDNFLHLQRFEITPPTLADMDAAYAAFVIYGKGTGHRAGLNFGDVFSYALAKVRNLPLLYKGNDFAETDLRPAAPNLSGSDAVTL
ncbi:MAG: type II toxin-antitoxin system VapC family toxin [Acetobacteraceae bacterium]|jgi:ribonuclease VapC